MSKPAFIGNVIAYIGSLQMFVSNVRVVTEDRNGNELTEPVCFVSLGASKLHGKGEDAFRVYSNLSIAIHGDDIEEWRDQKGSVVTLTNLELFPAGRRYVVDGEERENTDFGLSLSTDEHKPSEFWFDEPSQARGRRTFSVKHGTERTDNASPAKSETAEVPA